ncbi:alpha/beta fold hydrolase [Streptomyces wedmorensis]|uniref:thioesterase II family protein n=1 Tax=Streptomyces wedmorensis TaxID=43759 RepID=UPI003434161B
MNNSQTPRMLVPWNTEQGRDTALVCLPWAGAGASPFHSWAPVIGDAADVFGVRLAGRESRQTEPPATDRDEVVAHLVREVIALGAPRVVLFGHCSGALLAFETAHALLRSAAASTLLHLVVASQLPPSTFADTGFTPDRDLSRYVSEDLRGEPELLELLLPVLTADMTLVSGYAPTNVAPLDVPLTVVFGARDEELSRAAVDDWRFETTAPTTFREVPGAGHLFEGAAWPELAAVVRTALS